MPQPHPRGTGLSDHEVSPTIEIYVGQQQGRCDCADGPGGLHSEPIGTGQVNPHSPRATEGEVRITVPVHVTQRNMRHALTSSATPQHTA